MSWDLPRANDSGGIRTLHCPWPPPSITVYSVGKPTSTDQGHFERRLVLSSGPGGRCALGAQPVSFKGWVSVRVMVAFGAGKEQKKRGGP